jgi:hypothetical protein
MLMKEWMSDHEAEIKQAVKGTEEFFKRPCSLDNLEHLKKIRADRTQILAVAKYRLAKSNGLG